jgi:hypothetical protein
LENIENYLVIIAPLLLRAFHVITMYCPDLVIVGDGIDEDTGLIKLMLCLIKDHASTCSMI